MLLIPVGMGQFKKALCKHCPCNCPVMRKECTECAEVLENEIMMLGAFQEALV